MAQKHFKAGYFIKYSQNSNKSGRRLSATMEKYSISDQAWVSE
jgi:hypothetical protein